MPPKIKYIIGLLFYLQVNPCILNADSEDADSTRKDSKNYFGVFVGPNNTQWLKKYQKTAPLELNKPSKVNSLIGYSGGIFLESNISEISSIRLEIQMQKKTIRDIRASYSYSFVSGTYYQYTEYEDVESFTRFSMPFLYKIKHNNFYFSAGLYLGLAKYYEYYPVKKVRLWPHKGCAVGIGYNLFNRKRYGLTVELRDDLELMKLGNGRSDYNFYKLNTVTLFLGAYLAFPR